MQIVKDFARELADELAYRKPFVQEDNNDQHGQFCCVSKNNDVFAISYDSSGIITVEKLGQGIGWEPDWHIAWSGQRKPETDVLELAQYILEKEIGEELTEEDEDDEESEHGNSEESITNKTTREYAENLANGMADCRLYVQKGSNDQDGGFCFWSKSNTVYTIAYDSSGTITIDCLDYDGWNVIWNGNWDPETDMDKFIERIWDGDTGDKLTEKDDDDDEDDADDEESESDSE